MHVSAISTAKIDAISRSSARQTSHALRFDRLSCSQMATPHPTMVSVTKKYLNALFMTSLRQASVRQ